MTAARPGRGELDPDQLAALEEQRTFLLRSLADLDAEHEAGDLEDDDYATLHDDYTSRAAEVLRAIDDHRAAITAARPPRRPGRIAAVAVGVLAVAVLAGWLVAQSSGERKTGQTISGAGASLSPTEQASQCISGFGKDQPIKVLQCFQKVLDDDPGNPTALTYQGWVLYQYGVQAANAELQVRGANQLEKAVKSDPNNAQPHLFLAIIAKNNGLVAQAQAELAQVDKIGGLPPAMKTMIDGLRTEIAQAASSPSTTTTVPTTPPTSATGK